MNIQEFYTAVDGNYQEALGRLMDDARIVRFVKKFALNTDFAEFETCLAQKDYAEAFRHIHSVKGMSANLSMTRLFKSSDVLCEALRHGEPTVDVTPMVEEVKKDMETVLAAIAALD
ncbi:MAG: Hpt domain-containing protein [Abditibacteriota bacterium]|nr:Hpt domain-containing protein [Abditibacteriota bacterium]